MRLIVNSVVVIVSSKESIARELADKITIGAANHGIS